MSGVPASRWSSCTACGPTTSTRSSTGSPAKQSRTTSRCAGSKSGTTSPGRSTTAPVSGHIPLWNEIPFFQGQKKIVLRNCGLINPDDIEEYIAVGGYQSLYKVLIEGTPELVNEQAQGVQAARPRRRRLLDRHQVGVPAQGERATASS